MVLTECNEQGRGPGIDGLGSPRKALLTKTAWRLARYLLPGGTRCRWVGRAANARPRALSAPTRSLHGLFACGRRGGWAGTPPAPSSPKPRSHSKRIISPDRRVTHLNCGNYVRLRTTEYMGENAASEVGRPPTQE